MSKSRIKALQEQIDSSKRSIKVYRSNMSNHKDNGHPSHYQESGRRKIKSEQAQIKKYKGEIEELRGSKSSSGSKSVFKGNILFLPFRLIWWFVKLGLKG